MSTTRKIRPRGKAARKSGSRWLSTAKAAGAAAALAALPILIDSLNAALPKKAGTPPARDKSGGKP